MKINTFMERYDVSERTTYRLIENGELEVLEVAALQESGALVNGWFPRQPTDGK